MYGALLAQVLHRDSIRLLLQKRLTFQLALVFLIISAVILINFTSLPLRRLVVALTLPMLICYTVLHPTEWVGRFLELSGMRWIGRLSFSCLDSWDHVPVRSWPLFKARDALRTIQ
jgi:peptidoglycan/LPS O-acetylase OafA/YrhL